MQRRNRLNVQSSRLLEESLNTRAILANNIDEVAASFPNPGKILADCPEGTKSIRREEDLLTIFI